MDTWGSFVLGTEDPWTLTVYLEIKDFSSQNFEISLTECWRATACKVLFRSNGLPKGFGFGASEKRLSESWEEFELPPILV